MKKLLLLIVLILLSFQTLYSQTKEIKGDTAYWLKRTTELRRTLDLKDFEKSADDFNFRFWNYGQVIEISKDSSKINGSITNYIYHTKKAKRSQTETITNKIFLSSKQSEDVYNIVQNAKVLELPSDRYIENWGKGTDGTTYIIEHADNKNYWLKNYWTPSVQNLIPEAVIVLDLIKNLSDTLNLQDVNTSFKNSLPKIGCYNSGGMATMCYVSNSLELGYSGATKLPFGFYSSYSATYIGKTKINGSASLQYNFDRNQFHHLNLQIAKWHMFQKKSDYSDFIAYNYQNRKLNVNDTKSIFENHQIKYGLNLKKDIAIGIGFDYLIRTYSNIGGLLYASKWFSKTNISTIASASIFEDRVNYKAEIFKSIDFNNKFPARRITLGIAYENFMKYKDLYFSVRLLL